MNQSRTPALYASGQWAIRTPFSVNPQAIYVCKAIRTLDELEAQGIDPYAEFYEPKGIERSVYSDDVRNLANIITLMSDTQPTAYVPDTYIERYPDTTVVPYRHVVLSLSLGAVPDTLALADLEDKLKETVLDSIGIETQIKTFQAGALASGVDQMTHRAAESNRLARIANNQTRLAQLRAKDQSLETVLEKNRILVQLCKDNGIL